MTHFNGNRTLASGLTALLFAAVLSLSLSKDFYNSSMTNPYLSLALFSALTVLGMIRRSWLDLLWVLAGGLLLAVLDYRVMGFRSSADGRLFVCRPGRFAALGTYAIWAEGEERKLLLYGFVPIVLFVGSEWMASTLLDITEASIPRHSTCSCIRLIAACGCRSVSWWARRFRRWPSLWWTCFVFYTALPLPLALVYAAQLRRAKRDALAVMIAFLVTGPLGVMFYNVLPACGPVHLFGAAFPCIRFPPRTRCGPRRADPDEGRSQCHPVVAHDVGAAYLVELKRASALGSGIALAFVWFTVLATLGTGEHYFVDLVVAFPFSLMVQALCTYSLPFRNGERRTAFLFGTFVTLVWLAFLSYATRFFWISPVIPWAMIVATISSSVFCWHRLLRARSEELPVPPLAAAAGAAS